VYRPLGVGIAGEPGVGSAADGRLEVFVGGNDDHLWHLYQTSPNGALLNLVWVRRREG